MQQSPWNRVHKLLLATLHFVDGLMMLSILSSTIRLACFPNSHAKNMFMQRTQTNNSREQCKVLCFNNFLVAKIIFYYPTLHLYSNYYFLHPTQYWFFLSSQTIQGTPKLELGNVSHINTVLSAKFIYTHLNINFKNKNQFGWF